MKKFVSIAVLIAVLVALVPASMVGATPAFQGEDYTVQADDWLSKLADKFYGDVNAYWAIMAATNQANAEDSSYTKIENPDAIEVGAKLAIPNRQPHIHHIVILRITNSFFFRGQFCMLNRVRGRAFFPLPQA